MEKTNLRSRLRQIEKKLCINDDFDVDAYIDKLTWEDVMDTLLEDKPNETDEIELGDIFIPLFKRGYTFDEVYKIWWEKQKK